VDALIETQNASQAGDLIWARVLGADHDDDRVAGDQPEDREDDKRDPKEQRDHRQQPAHDEPAHSLFRGPCR